MRTIYLISVCLHIVAAMVWVGGMAVLVTAVMPNVRRLDEPRRATFMHALIGRVRTIMWLCFAVLAVTGPMNLWFRGVRLADVTQAIWWSSRFGSLVGAKIALFAATAMLTLGHERVRTRTRARWLGRLTFAVSLAMIVVAVALVRGF